MSRTINASFHQTAPSITTGTVRSHSVLIDRPAAMNGTDAGPMGGELLLLALGGCFMSNLLAAIRTREAIVSDIRLVVEASIDGTPERMTRFTLRLMANHAEDVNLEKLAIIAERGCLVANTLSVAAPITLVVEESGDRKPVPGSGLSH